MLLHITSSKDKQEGYGRQCSAAGTQHRDIKQRNGGRVRKYKPSLPELLTLK